MSAIRAKSRQVLVASLVCVLFACFATCIPCASARAQDAALDALYARVATDLQGGAPLRVRIYVALCDNASQGIVPVKNPAICDGEAPDRNIYWVGSGGLRGYLDGHGWQRTAYETAQDPREPVLIRARWTRRFASGGRLRALGVRKPIEVEIEALAYRGRRIRSAMADYVADVHGAAGASAPPHLVGYIGHDYYMDTLDDLKTWTETRSDAQLPRGVFALSCSGEQVIRPHVTRPVAPLLVLNRSLTYPGAWTVGGLVEGFTQGRDGRGIHALATEYFTAGKQKPRGSLNGVFSYGDTAAPTRSR
jgi:hypothetical protein